MNIHRKTGVARSTIYNMKKELEQYIRVLRNE